MNMGPLDDLVNFSHPLTGKDLYRILRTARELQKGPGNTRLTTVEVLHQALLVDLSEGAQQRAALTEDLLTATPGEVTTLRMALEAMRLTQVMTGQAGDEPQGP